jgi:hypothetical protein
VRRPHVVALRWDQQRGAGGRGQPRVQRRGSQHGVHDLQGYESHVRYGPVRLREASGTNCTAARSLCSSARCREQQTAPRAAAHGSRLAWPRARRGPHRCAQRLVAVGLGDGVRPLLPQQARALACAAHGSGTATQLTALVGTRRGLHAQACEGHTHVTAAAAAAGSGRPRRAAVQRPQLPATARHLHVSHTSSRTSISFSRTFHVKPALWLEREPQRRARAPVQAARVHQLRASERPGGGVGAWAQHLGKALRAPQEHGRLGERVSAQLDCWLSLTLAMRSASGASPGRDASQPPHWAPPRPRPACATPRPAHRRPSLLPGSARGAQPTTWGAAGSGGAGEGHAVRRELCRQRRWAQMGLGLVAASAAQRARGHRDALERISTREARRRLCRRRPRGGWSAELASRGAMTFMHCYGEGDRTCSGVAASAARRQGSVRQLTSVMSCVWRLACKGAWVAHAMPGMCMLCMAASLPVLRVDSCKARTAARRAPERWAAAAWARPAGLCAAGSWTAAAAPSCRGKGPRGEMVMITGKEMWALE